MPTPDLNGSVGVEISVSQRAETGLEIADFEVNKSVSNAYTPGVGANQADVLWSKVKTLDEHAISAPSSKATVDVTGGGSTGGLLLPGVYKCVYTYVTSGGETTPSPESDPFTVAAGNIPQVTLPSLPTDVDSISLYLTKPGGSVEYLYATGITTTTYDLSTSGRQTPSTNTATIDAPTDAPTIDSTGGGATGGLLAAGTYHISYTYANYLGETTDSPDATFTVSTLGNIPRVTLPSLPDGVSWMNVYVSNTNQSASTKTLYNTSGVTSTTYDLASDVAFAPVSNTANIVAPTSAPTTSTTAASSLTTGTYFAKYTYVNSNGETTASPAATVTVSGGLAPTLVLPTQVISGVTTPLINGATSINIYLTRLGVASGGETLYKTGVTSTPVTLDAAWDGMPTANTCVLPSPAAAPTVTVSGVGTGATLTPGNYYVKYTYFNSRGETTASPESTQFTVGVDQIPRVTLPALPAGITGINLYATPRNAGPAAVIKYNSAAITTTTYDMPLPVPSSGSTPPSTNTATIASPTTKPTVSATGGGSVGGSLVAGTYRVGYTYVTANGESRMSPESDPFTIAAGNIPRVTLPALPSGVTKIRLYSTSVNGAPGYDAFYADNITTTTYDMSAAASQAAPAFGNGAYLPNPGSAPTFNVTGGGSVGGALQAGTYYAVYTYTGSNGESAPSDESSSFTVSSGNIPRMTFAAIPAGYSTAKLYLTPPGGAAGTETLYASGLTGTSYDLATAHQNVLPPASSTAVVADPATAPTVSIQTGAGSLAVGTYYLKYTLVDGSGETLASPETLAFTVTSGTFPRVTLGSLPVGATSFSVYLSLAAGGSGSERLYATGVTGSTYDLTSAFTTPPPTASEALLAVPSTVPTVSPTGGGSGGGSMLAGSYYCQYSFYTALGETPLSPSSALFTIASGNIPRVTLPALPTGASGITLYLTAPGGAQFAVVYYATSISTTTYDMSAASLAPPVVNGAVLSAPNSAATVSASGGSLTGTLPAGTYLVSYSWSNSVGETLTSPRTTFTSSLGNIPRVFVPTPPTSGVTTNVYITLAGGAAGTETLYGSTTGGYFDIPYALTYYVPLSTSTAVVSPPVGALTCTSVASGISSIAPGTYIFTYTYNSGSNETLIGPETTLVHTLVSGVNGAIRVVIPAAPAGVTTANLYCTAAGGASGTEVRTSSSLTIATGTFTLNSLSGSIAIPSTATFKVSDPGSPATTTATGGGSVGGSLPAGVYRYAMSLVNANGETKINTTPGTLTVVAGNIPSFNPSSIATSLATGVNVYLSAVNGSTSTLVKYNSTPISTSATSYAMSAAHPSRTSPSASTASIAAPTAAATVSATGGGSVGGLLAAGTYYLKYTAINGYPSSTGSGTGETTPSPSVSFTVAAGNIPRVTIPTLPTGASAAKVYVTPVNGADGTEILYASGVASGTYDLASGSPGSFTPASNTASITAPGSGPTVSATGGGSVGGLLAAGTYKLSYTYVNSQGESTPSPETNFTISSGNIPRVTLPAVPQGISSCNVYVTGPGGASGQGNFYASVSASTTATTTYDMTIAASTVAKPSSNTCLVTAPTTAATAIGSGGGFTGGSLAPGSYLLTYTYVNSNGETTAAPESTFSVASGYIPQITLPGLADGATGYNVYLSPVGGATGSEVLHGEGVTDATYTIPDAWSVVPPTSSTAVLAYDTIDLNGVLKTILGDDADFARVKAVVIVNDSEVDGEDIWFSPAGSNGWTSIFNSDTSAKIKIGPSGFIVFSSPLATGYPVVSGTGDQIKIDGGAVPIQYEIAIIGCTS